MENINVINAFPGYEYIQFGENGKQQNMYRGTDVGFGGYVYSEPGIYTNVALLDVASMHPSSIISMNYFGEYTKNYENLVKARIAIKHGDYDIVRKMFDGKLAKYLQNEDDAKALSQAIKLPINACYGLTSAKFENAMRDSRNVNNIVALKGALFMRTLQDELNERGFKTIHIKTDSVKIPDATPEIIQFCMDFANKYGYTFEHEATYERMCLINKADYIARYPDGSWTATGAYFSEPYVFKTLFSKESITFDDLCETFEVKKGALYLDMNESLPHTPALYKELEKRETELKKSGSTSRSEDDSIVYFDKQFANTTTDDLKAMIAEEHNYVFVGRVGRFSPVVSGVGGGELYRVHNGKPSAASGSKGYRWLESEKVKTLGKEDSIDKSYYTKLVDDALETIGKYGDVEWFLADDKE